jgi:phage-Barnase-EndoU-ColicinE5/D-RelE like nuclease3
MAQRHKKHNHRLPLDLGQLPIELIERTLGLELDPGEVVFSVGAQIHAAKKHPHDFASYLPFVGTVVANPLYLGDDARNRDKIEFISRLPGQQGGLLVAVEVCRDVHGKYNVCSIYTVKQSQIEARRLKGYLKSCK